MSNHHHLTELPKIVDTRGNLSFFENNKQVPFEIQRVYWVYDVPGGEVRGSHAFKTQNEFIMALSGSFDVVIHDGREEMKYTLNRSYYGIFIPKLSWRRIENFSTNSLALIAVDQPYIESDYIRDFNDFVTLVAHA